MLKKYVFLPCNQTKIKSMKKILWAIFLFYLTCFAPGLGIPILIVLFCYWLSDADKDSEGSREDMFGNKY